MSILVTEGNIFFYILFILFIYFYLFLQPCYCYQTNISSISTGMFFFLSDIHFFFFMRLVFCNHVTKNVSVTKFVDREEGGGNRRTFNTSLIKINKHKSKAAAPHGRLPHSKHKLKVQAWSSLVFHCRRSSFYPSGAPPWDSRPVSGAGVAHYH